MWPVSLSFYIFIAEQFNVTCTSLLSLLHCCYFSRSLDLNPVNLKNITSALSF